MSTSPRWQPKSAKRPSQRFSRNETLRAAGLLFAPAQEQRAFWAKTNRTRRNRTSLIGETLATMLNAGLGRTLRHAARVHELLEAVLPREALKEIEIGALHRGTLTLHVPSGAAAYDAERRHAPLLLEAFTAAAPDLGIRRVRFTVASDQRRESRSSSA